MVIILVFANSQRSYRGVINEVERLIADTLTVASSRRSSLFQSRSDDEFAVKKDPHSAGRDLSLLSVTNNETTAITRVNQQTPEARAKPIYLVPRISNPKFVG